MELAVAFALFGVGVLAARALPRRAATRCAWVLLTAGCVVIAWVAVIMVARGTSRPLLGLALPLIGPFDFELPRSPQAIPASMESPMPLPRCRRQLPPWPAF